ncbi:hypothetical protein KVT40_006378 [Elsinoe batatas]|uniref:Secreted protein n=1 Tax=Elsinoe batatas TaxID=2601811 RepID=A0A8K0KYQ2_9PEZI|nr:hypothetical protein KVT40_006378 [Elsinoe batatas]
MVSLNPIRLLVSLLFYSAIVIASSTTRWKIGTNLTAFGAYFCRGGGAHEMATAWDPCSQQGRTAVCVLASSGAVAKHVLFFEGGYLTVERLREVEDRIIDHQTSETSPKEGQGDESIGRRVACS